MLEFNLPAMSCGHCVSAVSQACKEVDPQARVEVNLATKEVKVESAASRDAFVKALVDAGYSPA